MSKKSEYNENSIQVIKGLEAVRKRPTVYMGPRGNDMLLQMLKEPVDNCLDEALEGRNNYIEVLINLCTDEFFVSDKAQGIPVGPHPTEKKSTLEVVLTTLHAGAKFGSSGYKEATAGTHGIGVAATNALSLEFEVWTYRKGWYYQKYVKGKPLFEVKKSAPKEPHKILCSKHDSGTIVRFVPDHSVVDHEERAKLNVRRVVEWLKTLSLMNKGIKIVLTVINKNGSKTVEFLNNEGPTKLLSKRLKELDLEPLCKPFLIDTPQITCAFVLTNSDLDQELQSFVNTSPTRNGGTHVRGFMNALAKSLDGYKKKGQKLETRDFLMGMIGLLNVKLKEPEFKGQVKEELVSPVSKVVEEALTPELTRFFAKNKSLARDLVKKAVEIKQSREQFRKVVQTISGVKKAKKVMLPGILTTAKCDARDRELYVVEGDSAGGSAKKARDSRFQEVFKLTGKSINAVRASLDKLLDNKVIQNLFVALGIDINNLDAKTLKIDCSKLRVARIFLLADADEDGPLAGNTRVLTLDGRNPTIAQLEKEYKETEEPIWVYSYNEDNVLVPAKAYEPKQYTTVTKRVRVKLDNGYIIRCTLNHKWSINTDEDDDRVIEGYGHFFVRAKDLRVGDSIKSVYFDYGDADGNSKKRDRLYKIIRNDGTGKSIPVHRWVMKNVKPKTFAKYKAANKGVMGGAFHIHHKDDNSLNNSPGNLTIIGKGDHFKEHGDLNKRAYNGSAKHLRDLSAFRSTEEGKHQRDLASRRIYNYNVSDKHRQTVSENNSKPYIIDQQKLGKCCRFVIDLIKANMPLTKSIWDTYRPHGIASYSKMQTLFGLEAVLVGAIKFGLTLENARLLRPRTKHLYPTQAYSKFLTVCSEVVERGLKLTPENYTRVRKFRIARGDPKWETMIEKLGISDIDLIKQAKEKVNHKVVAITIEECEPTPMYCMTVPDTGNFMVDDGQGNGVCSSNSHVSLLILTVLFQYFPQLIKEGRVFVVDAPLFHAFYKNRHYFGATHKECHDSMPKGSPKNIIIRAKGWGEIHADVLSMVAFDPESRGTIQLTWPQTKAKVKRFKQILGQESTVRKELLGL